MKERIRFTEYAEFQLREREIDPGDVKRVFNSPGQVLPGKKNRKIAQYRHKKNGQEGLLRVIFEEIADKIIISGDGLLDEQS